MNERPERLRLMLTFSNLFYTPVYVAVAGGFLYRHGLDVMFGTVPADRSSVGMLKSGEVDIVQTGISRSLMDLDEGHEDAPLHIAEINQRDGFYLLSREPRLDWTWRDLEGATLIPVGFTPVPWMSLKAAMVKNGVRPERVKLLPGLSAEDAIALFLRGEADYLHMVDPFARGLAASGDGRIVAAIGDALGQICYSSFAATPQFLEERGEIAQKFVNGFYEAQRWAAQSAPDEVARRVEPFFPYIPRSVLTESIEAYRERRTWSETPIVDRSGYDAMRDLLIEGGLVRGKHPYERLVRAEFAERAISGTDTVR
jgi:NitT/TauT family transport system substrate-binding protein